MPTTIGIRDLKNETSRIVRAVREEMAEYVITLQGKPVALLRPITEADEQQLHVVSAEIPDTVTSGDDGRDGFQTRPTPDSQGAPATLGDTEGYPVRAGTTGYIQYIDPEIMLALAREKNLVIRLPYRPGHFVSPGAVIALVWSAGRVDGQLDKLVRRAFQIGNGRTPTQDVEYAVNQLTEMAVRAMSPAINDPFTAMTCLDHLGEGLVNFIRQGEKGSHYTDRDGRRRLVLEPVNFGELLSAAFDMLRHTSCDNASVLLHMLAVIDAISQEAQAPEARRLLLRHVSLIQAESECWRLDRAGSAGDEVARDSQSLFHPPRFGSNRNRARCRAAG